MRHRSVWHFLHFIRLNSEAHDYFKTWVQVYQTVRYHIPSLGFPVSKFKFVWVTALRLQNVSEIKYKSVLWRWSCLLELHLECIWFESRPVYLFRQNSLFVLFTLWANAFVVARSMEWQRPKPLIFTIRGAESHPTSLLHFITSSVYR